MSATPTLNHSVVRTHGFESLTVEGELPNELRGAMYRVGPGLLERFGRPAAHPFDADGAITAVRLGATGATGACRVVESPEYREEERVGRFLYGTSASWPRRMLNTVTGRKKSTGNTNVLAWQGRLFALMEEAKPVEFDPHSLQVRAATDLGVVRSAFSAHPHRVDALKTTFNFGIRGKSVDLYALPDNGPARVVGSFDLPWIGMIHDFIVTDKHAVFIVGPAKLIMWRAMFAIGDLSQYFRWEPESGTIVVVVPLNEPQRAVRFTADTFWVWHFVNAFEDGGRIVVDVCRHDDFRAFAAPSSAGPEHGQPALHRFSVDLARRTLAGESMWRSPSEFPSVHPLKVGARHRYTWLQTFPDATHNPGVARFDNETGHVESWAAPAEHLGAEPMFIAQNATEEAGWVLQLFQDPQAQRSYLAVLDAEHLADGPKAKVWFNQPVPMTFHGVFVPQTERVE